ncbi:hypothetical protein Nepgr_020951 [Nepenthes gracilis]|uniref:Exocyst complex subunit Exo70 C-terminal domain-containing protein n=1 Tax=Nepenthes gracilis TaxID=150966 RepID=A0AAD3XWS1_NEPGR|nr:hypothetical protein Nepgr_020951 [Nepenthes gracilis]
MSELRRVEVNGKVHKPTLKERFKNFNQLFDDIHKTQSTGVVNDELTPRSSGSISPVMIPAIDHSRPGLATISPQEDKRRST